MSPSRERNIQTRHKHQQKHLQAHQQMKIQITQTRQIKRVLPARQIQRVCTSKISRQTLWEKNLNTSWPAIGTYGKRVQGLTVRMSIAWRIPTMSSSTRMDRAPTCLWGNQKTLWNTAQTGEIRWAALMNTNSHLISRFRLSKENLVMMMVVERW